MNIILVCLEKYNNLKIRMQSKKEKNIFLIRYLHIIICITIKISLLIFNYKFTLN